MDDTDGLTSEGQVEIEQLLTLGRKIEAIKRYRELTGVDLATAKTAVERMAAADHPELAGRSAKPIKPSGCAVLCVAAAVVTTTAVLLLV